MGPVVEKTGPAVVVDIMPAGVELVDNLGPVMAAVDIVMPVIPVVENIVTEGQAVEKNIQIQIRGILILLVFLTTIMTSKMMGYFNTTALVSIF
jgi:hypothetical protein